MSCEICGHEVKNYGVFMGGIRCKNYCNIQRGHVVTENKLRKLTSKNQKTFFNNMRVGDSFVYAGTVMGYADAFKISADNGFRIRYNEPKSELYTKHGVCCVTIVGRCEKSPPVNVDPELQTNRMSLHESKLRYVNAVISECNLVAADAEACKQALAMLPKEVKDLTEQDCERIAAALPARCAGNVQRKTPRFNLTPLQRDEHDRAMGLKSF
jgi:hypothetical protein